MLNIDAKSAGHGRTGCYTYRCTMGGSGRNPDLEAFQGGGPPAGPGMVDLQTLIDGEPETAWSWSLPCHGEGPEARRSAERPSEAFSLDPASRAQGSPSPMNTDAWRDAGVTSPTSQVTE